MVSRKVMTTAAAHSHHSRRSIRRKFARRGAVCASPIWPTVFALRSRNHHLLVCPFSFRLRLGLHAIGEFVAESMASEHTVPKPLIPVCSLSFDFPQGPRDQGAT